MSVAWGEALTAAAALGPLLLGRARARAQGLHGSHKRRTAGPGSDFWQYRMLEPGEAVDRVDWRRSGRSDSLFVRQHEREDPVRLWLWVDGSGSMDFASAPGLPTKLDRARLLAGALAAAAAEAGERLVDMMAPAETRTTAVLFEHLGRESAGLPPSAALRPGDSIVLVGDFLDGTPIQWAEAAAGAGAIGLAIAVFDPAEEDFPFSGRTRFEPSEPGEAARELARAQELQSEYRAAWARHRDSLRLLDQIGSWTCLPHRTDTPPAATLAAAAAWLRG